jgi:hypothetical protein
MQRIVDSARPKEAVKKGRLCMASPETVSLHIPYAENEKEFLILAVQAAVRTFRNIRSSETTSPSTSQTSQSTYKIHP